MAGGGVQTDVTREAVQETLREFRDIGGERPVDEAEFEAAKAGLLRQFPSSFETPWQVLEQMAQIVFDELPDDYYRSSPPTSKPCPWLMFIVWPRSTLRAIG